MRYFLLLLAIMILSGCAHDTQQPVISQDNQTVQETDTAEKQEQTDQFEYHPDTEVPEGSGIFTGKDGEFRVFY